MRIGGFIDNSLVDFPGYTSAVIFTAGCNFNCEYCHDSALIPIDSGKEMTIDEIMQWANKVVPFADAFCVTGGEPTIQEELPDLLKALRTLNKKIALCTNGSNLDMIKNNSNYIDMLFVDIKGDRHDYQSIIHIDNSEQIYNNLEQFISMKIPITFRTTVAFNHYAKGSILAIYSFLSRHVRLNSSNTITWVIQNYIGDRTGLKSPTQKTIEFWISRWFGNISKIKIIYDWR